MILSKCRSILYGPSMPYALTGREAQLSSVEVMPKAITQFRAFAYNAVVHWRRGVCMDFQLMQRQRSRATADPRVIIVVRQFSALAASYCSLLPSLMFFLGARETSSLAREYSRQFTLPTES